MNFAILPDTGGLEAGRHNPVTRIRVVDIDSEVIMYQSSIMRKSMLATVLALSWPTILEQLLTTIIQYVDTAMVGQIGATASAVVGLSMPVGWLIISPMIAAGTACLVVLSKALGEGNTEKVRTVANQSFIIILILAAVEGIITLAVSPFFPAWMDAEETIHRDASLYFAIVCAPMFFRVMITVGGMVIRATGDTKTPMLINVLMNLLNILINYFLINPSHTVIIRGRELYIPGTGWGAVGAGVATAISFVFGGTLMLIAFCRNQRLGFRFKKLRYHSGTMSDCIRLAMPLGITRVITGAGYVVFSGMVSGLGTVAFAAHSIANTAESLFYIPGYGMQSAASTIAGYAWGRNDRKLYFSAVKTCVLVVTVLMSLSGGFLFLFAEPLMDFFSNDREVIRQGVQVLRIVSLTEPFFGAGVVMTGLYNGVGITKFPLVIEISTMWIVRILLTYICVNHLGCGLVAVWYCMVANNIIMTVIFAVRMFLPGVFREAEEQPKNP